MNFIFKSSRVEHEKIKLISTSDLCALRRDTNMAAVTEQKHLSLSFATEMKIFTLEL